MLFSNQEDRKMEHKLPETCISECPSTENPILAHSSTPEQPQECKQKQALVVVDPWSTGNKLCELIINRGFELIIIWEEGNIRSPGLRAREVIIHTNDSEYGEEKTLNELERIQIEGRFSISGIIPGSETGVLLAEKLAYRFGTPTNPPKLALARRNKYLMGEAVRKSGERAVQQTIATEWNHVKTFLSSFNPDPFKIVVKPNLGAGSDDVFMCNSVEEVKTAFFKINGSINSLGIKNDGVLIQEFLQGKEYVIDTMSRNGHHKIIAMWEYDKRPANGRFNVYFGTKPHAVNGEVQHSLKDYVMSVLDALEVHNGPGHAEVIMTKTGPCLVEIGCRCHGGNASWYNVAREFAGHDQLNAVVDGFTSEENFRKIPDFVSHNMKYGKTVDLVAYEAKEILEVPGIEYVKSLKSFNRINLFKNVGDVLDITVDCNSTPGEIILIHEDKQQVERDFEAIHELLKSGFFILKNDEDMNTSFEGSCSSVDEDDNVSQASSYEE